MSNVGNRKIDSFQEHTPLEGQVFRYLALKEHERKLLGELKKTREELKNLKDNPLVGNAIGEISRLEKVRENKLAEESSGDEVEEETEAPSRKRARSELAKKASAKEAKEAGGIREPEKKKTPTELKPPQPPGKKGSKERLEGILKNKETAKSSISEKKDELQNNPV